MFRSILLVVMLSSIAFAQAQTPRRDKVDVPITYRLCDAGLKECSIVVKRMSDLSPDRRRETRDALRIPPGGGEEGDSQCHWVDTTLFCWTNDIKGNCGCVFVPGASTALEIIPAARRSERRLAAFACPERRGSVRADDAL